MVNVVFHKIEMSQSVWTVLIKSQRLPHEEHDFLFPVVPEAGQSKIKTLPGLMSDPYGMDAGN